MERAIVPVNLGRRSFWPRILLKQRKRGLQEGPLIRLRDALGYGRSLYGAASIRSHKPTVWTSGVRVEIPRLSSKPETARRIAACTMGMPFDLLVAMDALGPATSVTLCRTYRRIRWSAPVIRSSEAAEAVSRGHQRKSTHARCDPGIANGIRQSYDTIPQPVRSQAGSINGNPFLVSNSIRSCSR
jgi:hypothetical protein